MILQVGKTTDGRGVVVGIYRYYETHGIPLDVLLEALRDKGYIPDWRAFVQEALAAGMKKSRVLSMLEPALADVYGGAFRDHVLKRLESV